MTSVFGFTGPPDDQSLRHMDRALAHRGGSQLFSDCAPAGTLCCRPLGGETRLARAEGLYCSGDITIALAGYLTNPEDFQGPVLPLLIERFRKHGPDIAHSLRGAYVLAIRHGRELHLVRDGAGARTVYWGRYRGRVYFAVEPKGILAVPGFPRRIRPGAVAQYLTFSFIPGRATMLEDVCELPAGCRVSFKTDGSSEVRRHFEFETLAKDDRRSETEWVGAFQRVFTDALRRRLPRHQPVGIFLSGGIDSSIVTAESARLHDGPLKTYAVHFGSGYPHELDYARAVADRAGTEHAEVCIRPKDFLPRLRRIIWHLDDPIGDPITVPNFELAARVAGEVQWVLNGEGGDPLFGGPKNIPMLLHHWYGGIERSPHFRERHYLASYRRCYEDLEQLLTRDFRKRYDPRAELEGILAPYFAARRPANFVDKLQAINIRLKGAHLILPKVDRMTGAWGLRQLAPLFDERLIRMSMRMPTTLKLRGGIEKVILKKAFQGRLPPAVIARPKSGMRVPVYYWFRKEMKRYARKILAPRQLGRTGIFNAERVRDLLKYNIEEGPGRYGMRLWMLITFEIWRRIVVEGERP